MKKGYVQIYTGNGKGKTTAAIGLAVRAAGANMRIYIGQFLKGKNCSEIKALIKISDNIKISQYGSSCFVKECPNKMDVKMAREGLEDIKHQMLSGKYDIVIMDEANPAVFSNLFPVECLLDIIDSKPENVELIITGRNAARKVLDRADLVTEMRDNKHYFDQGVEARRGIEM
jgi:cob(I)alamin adenosyltransferase